MSKLTDLCGAYKAYVSEIAEYKNNGAEFVSEFIAGFKEFLGPEPSILLFGHETEIDDEGEFNPFPLKFDEKGFLCIGIGLALTDGRTEEVFRFWCLLKRKGEEFQLTLQSGKKSREFTIPATAPHHTAAYEWMYGMMVKHYKKWFSEFLEGKGSMGFAIPK